MVNSDLEAAAPVTGAMQSATSECDYTAFGKAEAGTSLNAVYRSCSLHAVFDEVVNVVGNESMIPSDSLILIDIVR